MDDRYPAVGRAAVAWLGRLPCLKLSFEFLCPSPFESLHDVAGQVRSIHDVVPPAGPPQRSRGRKPTNGSAGLSQRPGTYLVTNQIMAWSESTVRLPRAAGLFPIVRMGRHIGQTGSPQQVVPLLAMWKLRGLLPDHSSERCDAIPKREDLLETTCHDAGPIIRLRADRARGRTIPHLDLTLHQPLERLRDLPFLIARDARSQGAGFSYCFQPDLD